jgi:hypothetical protein
MTSRVIVPFDNNPVNTFVTDSTYTVPTGKFAKVTCTLHHAILSLNGNVVSYTLSAQDVWTITDGANQSGGERDMGTSTRYGKYYIQITNGHYNNDRSHQLRQYRDDVLIWTSPNISDSSSSYAYRLVKKGDVFRRYMSGSQDSGTFTCVFYADDGNVVTSQGAFWSGTAESYFSNGSFLDTSKVYEFWVKEGDVVSLENPLINTNVQETGQGFDTIASILVQEYNKVS